MQRHERIASARLYCALSRLMVLVGLAAMLPTRASAQSWVGYGRGPQHSALASGPSQVPQVIRWSTPVDLQPQYAGGAGGDLYTHYGSPAITAHNTVLVPVKTGAGGSFTLTAITGGSGNVLWTLDSDYQLPSHNWIPPMGIVLMGADLSVAMPGAGGTVITRTAPDLRRGQVNRMTFVGMANYKQDPAAFNAAIQIDTPLTADANGNLYFGYVSSGAALPGYPNGIPSGLARISRKGAGSFVAASALCGDNSIAKVVTNCTPAISTDGGSVYVAVNKSDFSDGYLCKATADDTLTPLATVYLRDPNTGGGAWLSDDGTASPTVGPDGDVYFGVLEQNIPSHHDRGWLLHYDSALKTKKIPGSFGWDDSASIVPSRLVPSYTGSSPYLLLTKYNDYSDPGIGGTGQNRVAILDPNATEPDPITPGVQVMKEVITVVGVTPNTDQAGVREWCINSAAIDEAHKCAVINSEDGHVYRWSFTTNTLTTGLKLAPSTGEAYTPTAIGPDGAVYAINNAKLFCCIAGSGTTTSSAPPPAPALGTDLGRSWPVLPAGALALALLAAAGLTLGAWAVTRRFLVGPRLEPLYLQAKSGR